MNPRPASAIGLLTIGALLSVSGCAQPARNGTAGATTRPAAAGATTTQPALAAATDDWPALPVPANYDAKKAGLTLAKVPNDPSAPAATGATTEGELPRQAMQHIEEARRLFAEQRYSETTQELERALRYNAESHEARRMMAIAAMRSGDDERAQSAADKALAIKPNDLAAHYVRARMSEKAGQRDPALREYRLALKSEPADPQSPYRLLAAYYLSNLLFEDGYYAAAIEQANAFEAGLAALGDKAGEDAELAALARAHRGTAIIRTARAYGVLGDYAKAATTLKQAVNRAPKDNNLRIEYINMLGRSKRSDEVVREAARFVADTNGDPAAAELLLSACRRTGHPEKALDIIKQLAQAQPDNTDLWKLYIDALSAAKRYEEVVTALNELVARHPDAIDSRWRLIQLTRERGDWPKWFNALVQHLQNQPQEYGRVMDEFAHLPADTAKRMAAELDKPANQRRLLPPEPTDPQAASALDILLARLASRQGRAEQAQALTAQATKRTPGFLPAAIVAAEVYVGACQWKPAIELIEGTAKSLSTPSARLEYLLAQSYDGLDDVGKALEHYQEALKLDDKSADTMLALGRLYERGQRGKDATALYQKAIAAAPENMRAREILVRNLLFQAAQTGRPSSRLQAEVKDMQRIAPEDPATIRCAALIELMNQGSGGRGGYIDALRKLAHNHPEDAVTREDLVSALIDANQFAEARDWARELVRLEPHSADAGELLGLAELRMLDLPASAAALDQALAAYPNRESLLGRRAQVAQVVQDYDTAIKCYERLVGHKYTVGQQTTYHENLVDVYAEAHRFDEGRKVVESWIKQADDEAELIMLRRYLLSLDAAAGDVEQYVTRVRSWLKADPKSEYLRSLLIGGDWGTGTPMGLIGQKRYDEAVLLALTLLEESLKTKANDRNELTNSFQQINLLLTTLQAAGRNDEAIEVARNQASAQTDSRGRAVALFLLRVAYLRANKIDEAIAVTQELLNGEQASPTDDRILVTLLSRAGRNDDAIAQINRELSTLEQQKTQIEAVAPNITDPRQQRQIRQKLSEIAEQKATLLRTVSYAYQRKGQDGEAKARLRAAYQLDPDDAGVNNDLGYILADTHEDLQEAERMVRLALGEQPRQAAYQDSFAWVLYKKGDLQGAKTWLQRAIATEEGQDPVVYDHLADVEWRLGDKDAAKKHWQKSLEAHELQLRSGLVEMEKDIVDRVKAKLNAAESNGQPQVAPLAAETRPAK